MGDNSNHPGPGGLSKPGVIGVPGPATTLPGTFKLVGNAAIQPGTVKFAAGGTGGGYGGGGGGGGSAAPPLAPLITWPKLTPPAWYTGPPKNLNQLAALVRNAFFAGLGDLSGYPYNSLIVVGGTVYLSITSAGTVPAGLVIQATLFALDSNGNVGAVIASVNGPLTGGTATIMLNATMNKTYQYRLQVSINAGNVATGASYATAIDTQTGQAWFNGVPESLTIPKLASGGAVRVTVIGSNGPVGAGGHFNYGLVDTTIENVQGTDADPVIEQSMLAQGSATTDSDGGFTIDLTGVDYVQTDSMELDMAYVSGIPGAQVGNQKATFTGTNLAISVVPVTYFLSTGAAATGAADSITFTFTLDGQPYTGTVDALVGEQDLSVGQGFTESVEADGTGPSVTVAVPPAWESDQLYASWSAGTFVVGQGYPYGSNGPTVTLTVSAAGIAAGTASVTIEVTTGAVKQAG